MTQGEIWNTKYKEVVAFIKTNKRNPSRYDDEERGMYVNWLKHNKKLYATGKLKEDRVTGFKELLELAELYKRKNQYI